MFPRNAMFVYTEKSVCLHFTVLTELGKIANNHLNRCRKSI